MSVALNLPMKLLPRLSRGMSVQSPLPVLNFETPNECQPTRPAGVSFNPSDFVVLHLHL